MAVQTQIAAQEIYLGQAWASGHQAQEQVTFDFIMVGTLPYGGQSGQGQW